MTNLFDQPKKRSIKKFLAYSAVLLAGFVLASVIYTVFALVKNAPMNWYWILLITQGPWALLIALRIWYRYNYWQKRAAQLREMNDEMWDIVSGQRGEFLDKVSRAMVSNRGNYYGEPSAYDQAQRDQETFREFMDKS